MENLSSVGSFGAAVHVGSEREAALGSVRPQLLLGTMVGDGSTLLLSQNKHSSAVSV